MSRAGIITSAQLVTPRPGTAGLPRTRRISCVTNEDFMQTPRCRRHTPLPVRAGRVSILHGNYLLLIQLENTLFKIKIFRQLP